MIRLAPAFWLLLVTGVALATFAVKYRVQALTDQLAETVKATNTQERELRVLNAEWAYLNRPESLAQMNQRFLSLEPITTKQLQTAIADIPMRPAPPAPVTPAPAAPPAAAAPALVALVDPPLAEDRLPGNSPAVTTISLEQPATTAEAVKPARVVAYGGSGPRRSAKSDVARLPGSRSPVAPALDGRSLDLLIERVAAGR
jgi:hypothetical protein